jgi:ABC-2 type transport system ATP-binding protein
MKMITGYLQPDAGSISVCGLPVLENHYEAKQKIGYLPESNPLYLDMYVKEYLQFISGIHRLNNIKTAIANVIGLVGLTPESSKKIGQLSKGYKQRVGLAAALVHNPEVLILDEPTSGLDPNQIIEIREVIKNLAKEKTVLFSSHIMQEVEAICDRVIIINQGKRVADDLLSRLKQTHAGAGSVIVKFKNPVTAEALKEMLGIDQLPTVRDNGFVIQTSDPESMIRAITSLSLSRNLSVVSIETETNKLESIFKNLTGK